MAKKVFAPTGEEMYHPCCRMDRVPLYYVLMVIFLVSSECTKKHYWKKGGKKQKVAGAFKGPKLKKEERSKEETEDFHGLDRNGKRVLRPDEVSKAW